MLRNYALAWPLKKPNRKLINVRNTHTSHSKERKIACSHRYIVQLTNWRLGFLARWPKRAAHDNQVRLRPPLSGPISGFGVFTTKGILWPVIDGDMARPWAYSWYHRQLSQGQMANFPAFIASKSFDLWNRHIPQIKWHNLLHMLMY